MQKIAERAPSFQSLVCVRRSVYCAHRPEQLDSRANYISREFKLNQTRTREKIEAKNSGMRGTYGADNWPMATGVVSCNVQKNGWIFSCYTLAF